MTTQDMGTQPHSEKRKPYEPFRTIHEDPRVTQMRKSSEEKTYIVLYYNMEYEEYKFATFEGRYNTYFGIKDILDAESVDIRNSSVLVETVGIDPRTNNPKRYLMHPDEAASIYDFCHQMEAFFGDNAYSIEEYDTTGGDHIDEAVDYMNKHPEPTEMDYHRLNQIINSKHKTDIEPMSEEHRIMNEAIERDVSQAVGRSAIIQDNLSSSTEVFMDQEKASALGKQFFTPANMGDVESKEI